MFHDDPSVNSLSYFLLKSGDGVIVGMGIEPNSGNYTFLFSPSNSITVNLKRTLGWHNYTAYLDLINNLTFYIDGVKIGSVSLFDTIVEMEIAYSDVNTGFFTPDFYWDDFSIRDLNTKSPLFYITETVTQTDTITNTETTTVTTNQTTTVTNNVTLTNTVSDNYTTTTTISNTTTLTEINDVTKTETSTKLIETTYNTTITSSIISQTTKSDLNTTEPDLPKVGLSSDFLYGMVASFALIMVIFVFRSMR